MFAFRFVLFAVVPFLDLFALFVVVALLNVIAILYFVKMNTFKFNDVWYIGKEFKCYAKHIAVGIVLQLINTLIRWFISDEFAFIRLFYSCLIVMFVFGGIPYIMIIWVHKVNIKNVSVNNTSLKQLPKEALEVKSQKAVIIDANASVSSISCTHRPKAKVKYFRDLFDKSFDESNNYSNLSTEFELFVDHCKRELTLENLIFFIILIQFLQFLIENKFINAKNEDEVLPLRTNLETKHYIKDMDVIVRLKLLYEKEREKKEEICKDYSLFVPFFAELYREYFARDIAPFELNLNHELRVKLEYCFNKVKESEYISKEMFFQDIWPSLKETGVVVFRLLYSSFSRHCKRYNI